VQRIDIQRSSNFQLIQISILREYMLLEYKPFAAKMSMKFDIERIIDDFIFFCFFIGNDFLPALSALDISEGSLDHLINFYKKLLPEMKDYITDSGVIHWDRAEPFIAILGKHEHEVFLNRVKSLDRKYQDSKSFVSFDDNFSKQLSHLTLNDKTRILQENLKAKIKEKKVSKCKGLFQRNQSKKYKKFILMKKFSEDFEQKEGDDFVQY
jgi:5'-3' exonuclease